MDPTVSHYILPSVAHICDAGAGLGCFYLLLSVTVVLRFPREVTAKLTVSPAVTVLKPLHGAESGLVERLAAFCSQQYDGAVEVVCGVRDVRDPAIDAVHQLLGRHTPADVKLVIDGRERGTNRKISNLVNMLAYAKHDIMVLADSDIEVASDYLARVIAQLEQSGVGIVTCLYHGVAGPCLWSRLAALSINAYFLPSIIFASVARLERPCFGSTIALHRPVLSRIGGFDSFADCLADDYAMGAAVRSQGYRVVISPFSVGHVHFEESFWQLVIHELRIARTIRSIRPVAYCGTIITYPFALALIGLACGSESAFLIAALSLLFRLVLCRCVEHRFGLPHQPYWLIPFRDVLSFALFLASFGSTNINWRGMSYHVATNGRLLAGRDVS